MTNKPHSLVIGGTKGVGKAVSRKLAEKGHEVSCISRTTPDDKLPGVGYYNADLMDETTLYSALDTILNEKGPLHHLAFFQRYRGKEDHWHNHIELSLSATQKTIEYLSDKFAADYEGSIVLANSVLFDFIADEQSVGYHVAKAGIYQISRYYAVTLGPVGIRVNSVAFGVILKDENRDFYMNNEHLMNSFEILTPMRRMGSSDEIANLVAYLCSTESTFITGQNITIDGGVSLQSHDSLARNYATNASLKLSSDSEGKS